MNITVLALHILHVYCAHSLVSTHRACSSTT